MPTNHYSETELFPDEMIEAGGKLLGYVGMREDRAVIEFQGALYEQRMEMNDWPQSMAKVDQISVTPEGLNYSTELRKWAAG